ncbi:hypothetical protein C8Q74DRAFT_782137 [Fomes fomentarius]|nr:hypothetical protein C8Q74DRAFT_782137 [Fomes fomentarius]
MSQSLRLASPKKIPEPPHRMTRSYLPYLNRNDRVEFQCAKKLIWRLVPTALNLSLTWSRQDYTWLQDLISTIISAYPAFTQYTNNWPIRYYCQQHHARCRFTLKTHGTLPGRSQTLQSTQGPEMHLSPGPNNARERTEPVPSELGTTANNDLNSRLSMTYSILPDISFSRGPQQEEVEVFLRLVDPTLCALSDRFISAGISSESRLLAMARLPAEQLDIFLRCEVHTDAFESKLIRDGLQKLLTQATVQFAHW